MEDCHPEDARTATAGTVSTQESRADAGKAADPPPSRRQRKLDSLERVRRELAEVYVDQKQGRLDMETAKGRAYLLGQLVQVLKAEQAGGDLLDQLKRASDAELATLLQHLRERAKP